MWDERYREKGFAYGTAPNDFLRASMEFLPPAGNVLCLAAGEGRNAVFLAEHGHCVVAVDGSSVGLAKAAALAKSRGVVIRTLHADLADFSLAPLAYNSIISIFCHLFPNTRARLYGQINKALQPGGIFILEAFAVRQLEFATGGPRDPELLVDLASLKRDLKPLQLRYAVETERVLREGNYHSGMAAVVQIIGVKD